jgi:hypothetical protein
MTGKFLGNDPGPLQPIIFHCVVRHIFPDSGPAGQADVRWTGPNAMCPLGKAISEQAILPIMLLHNIDEAGRCL